MRIRRTVLGQIRFVIPGLGCNGPSVPTGQLGQLGQSPIRSMTYLRLPVLQIHRKILVSLGYQDYRILNSISVSLSQRGPCVRVRLPKYHHLVVPYLASLSFVSNTAQNLIKLSTNLELINSVNSAQNLIYPEFNNELSEGYFKFWVLYG